MAKKKTSKSPPKKPAKKPRAKKPTPAPTPPASDTQEGECEHTWEILQADMSSMSDGQISDYMAGCWSPARYLKCGVLTTLEGVAGDFGGDEF